MGIVKKVIKKKLSQKEIDLGEEVLKEIEGKEGLGSNSLSMFSDPLERFKWGICQEILKLKVKRGLSSVEIAKIMETDKSKVSLVFHYKVHNFSIDRLLSFFFKLQGLDQETDEKIQEIKLLFAGESCKASKEGLFIE